ncbi:tyrosine-type recombinase/integrase [Devosia sp.]|uniref:tyrosine-type recombinase/integrase n=1 Tax=Devosia sp. TaxID=1871048 RepID=UPI00292EAC7A|nr:tyrosine-type recombinase/integrase [Devosia sp.]
MARSAANNREHLEQHRGKWRVSIAVPKALQDKLGTRLKRPLNTDSLTIANQLKWPIIHEFKALIAQGGGSKTDIRAIAEEFRRQRKRAQSDDEAEEIETHISATIDHLLGPRIGEEVDPTGQPHPVYAPERAREAAEFSKVLHGRATPIEQHHAHYMAQLTVKPRTMGDDHRAIALLLRWCRENEVEPYLQSFPSKRAAVRFVDGLQALEPALSPVTLNKYLRRLSRYWQWMERREEVAADVWQGLVLPEPKVQHDAKERAFTDEEMIKLLSGPASPAMRDLIRIAALTGCRLDPIVSLRVRDCDGGLFEFKPQKKETATRKVPIHSQLLDLIAQRTAGKGPDEPVFPEWPPHSDPLKERSYKATMHFTAYRRSLGIGDEREGRRRALANFHSFRRWFITKAEQADQPPHIIASVVGHKREGMTLAVYSAGPAFEQAKRCVEAVRLPAGNSEA